MGDVGNEGVDHTIPWEGDDTTDPTVVAAAVEVVVAAAVEVVAAPVPAVVLAVAVPERALPTEELVDAVPSVLHAGSDGRIALDVVWTTSSSSASA